MPFEAAEDYEVIQLLLGGKKSSHQRMFVSQPGTVDT